MNRNERANIPTINDTVTHIVAVLNGIKRTLEIGGRFDEQAFSTSKINFDRIFNLTTTLDKERIQLLISEIQEKIGAPGEEYILQYILFKTFALLS